MLLIFLFIEILFYPPWVCAYTHTHTLVNYEIKISSKGMILIVKSPCSSRRFPWVYIKTKMALHNHFQSIKLNSFLSPFRHLSYSWPNKDELPPEATWEHSTTVPQHFRVSKLLPLSCLPFWEKVFQISKTAFLISIWTDPGRNKINCISHILLKGYQGIKDY